MAGAARFWDRMAERYARMPISDEAAYQEKLRITRDYLRPDMTLLEVGCGTGSTALQHAPHVRHIEAVDVSGKMLEIARRKAAEAGALNIDFRQADIETMRAGGQAYDAVLALSILHLLEDRDRAIGMIHDMLRPGGVFVSSTICLGDSALRLIAPITAPLRMLGLFPLLKPFRQSDLEHSLTRAGFTLDRVWRPGPRKAVFIVARKPATG